MVHVTQRKKKVGKKRAKSSGKRSTKKKSGLGAWRGWEEVIHDPFHEDQKPNDPVNKPAHYTDGKIEVIDFIEDKKLCFHLGNSVKYIARAGKKDPNKLIEDLEKAQWYLSRKISNLKSGK